MSGNLRREAIYAFKKLHRTRLKTFEGDDHALRVTRLRINEEFSKNKNLTDKAAIKELIKLANDVEHEIKTTIIQIVERKPGIFRAKITPDTVKVDNTQMGEFYNKNEFKQSSTKCCGGTTTKDRTKK